VINETLQRLLSLSELIRTDRAISLVACGINRIVYASFMVIEFLTFTVPTSIQKQWKALDEAVWTRFLEKQEGFVQKELWQSPEDSEKLHAVIWWRDKDSWKAITDEQIGIVDMEMGDYLIEPEMREFLVITDSE
tara:strand:+ start:12863 stop:13267 length:405 start_codon:yes stop_codon:yes gene_type:complete